MLRDDVFAAVADDRVVFLDLARDQYFALGAAASTRFAHWPLDERRSHELSAILTRRGLCALPRDGGARHPLSQVVHAPAQTAIEIAPRPAVLSAPAVSLARARARRDLAQSPLASVVAARRRRRAQWAGRGDRETATRAAATFASLRPLTRKNGSCLLEALALLNFLGRSGADADWVFAVRGEPFEAHCWIQFETIVLNDSVEGVAGYTPIMVV